MRVALVLCLSAALGCSDSEDESSASGGSAGNAGAASGGSAGTGGSVGTGGSAGVGASGGSAGSSGSGGSSGAAVQSFAVIGDFGDDFLSSIGLGGEALVAGLVSSWNPDFVITTGDNNYPDGTAATIDANIGKHYQAFIGTYVGSFGIGSPENRFWPSLGNHDWRAPNAQPYTDYFTLPGNERYYDVVIGDVHLFALDSDSNEPDGTDAASAQAQWAEQAIRSSTACYRIVYFHHPPYSSGDHGSSEGMRWAFEEWGASAVLAGHDHSYERIEIGGIPYFVNGLGGSLRYPEGTPVPESEVFFASAFGAQRVTVTSTGLNFEFFDVTGNLIDSREVPPDC
jgi:tartrate-resistant acid phosphatase type 5